EGKLTGIARPLALDRAERAAAGIMAALQPLYADEEVRMQWIFGGARTPRPVRAIKNNEVSSLLDLLDADQPLDGDALRAARLKQREPLLHAVVRVGVTAADRARWFTVFGRVWGSLRALNSPGAVMVRRWLPSFIVSLRFQEFRLPLTV